MQEGAIAVSEKELGLQKVAANNRLFFRQLKKLAAENNINTANIAGSG